MSHHDKAWNDQLLRNPHLVSDKRSRVQRMFSAIASSYDLNNRLHSFGRDQYWRQQAVRIAKPGKNDVVVDVACGTGDLTMAFSRQTTGPVMGIDFTYAMLPLASKKSARTSSSVVFVNGDAQCLPLTDACCDIVSIAFGIRNVQDIRLALSEFYRVLRPNGRVIVLEFSEPQQPFIRFLNRVYSHHIMPITASLIARDTSGAYQYLPRSIETFISRQQMTKLLEETGFISIEQHPMTFGVCVCYRGIKPDSSL